MKPIMNSKPRHQFEDNGDVDAWRKFRVRRRWILALDRIIKQNREKKNQLRKVVKALVEATRGGDKDKVKLLLRTYPNADLASCTDNLGQTPLTVAVKDNSYDMVASLLDHAAYDDWRECLLVSISMDHDEISELMIEKPRLKSYLQMQATREDPSVARSQFPAFLTPIILAAQRNQYGVVKLLLRKGERIHKPHHAHCPCKNCQEILADSDELEVAKRRLYTYRGLASDCYLSLNTSDPLLDAFRLGQNLKENAATEKYFKAEYKKLARQVSDYTVKLLGHVRSGAELDIILSQSTSKNDRDRLSRLKLAIRLEEKRFVTHPSCQKKIQYMWVDGWGPIQRKSTFMKLLWSLAFALCYPVLAAIYWVYPWGSIGKFLDTPVVRFIAEALNYLFFVCLLIVSTPTEEPSDGRRLTDHDSLSAWYLWYNASTTNPQTANVYVRVHQITVMTIIITVFILGYIWNMIKNVYRYGIYYFTDNRYNLMDACTYTLLTISMFFKYSTVYRIHGAIDYFSKQDSWQKLLDSTDGKFGRRELRLLDADRSNWQPYDGYFLAEVFISVAMLPALTRLTYMLAVNEVLGPLLISLKHMFKNFMIFMAVFLIIFTAFVASFRKLYWYYNSEVRKEAESPEPRASSVAEGFFGRPVVMMRSMMFALFGMTPWDSVATSDDYRDDAIEATGYVLFIAYNWISGVILLNMLIGMMAKAYDTISSDKDMEWKFDRTKLYLDYTTNDNSLCVPFNIIPTWWGIRNWCREISGCCRSDEKSDKGKQNYDNPSTAPFTCSPYQVVIERVRERFITLCTSSGEEEGVRDNTQEMLDQLKGELARLRQEMARSTSRNEQHRKTMFASMSDLEAKLEDRLSRIMLYCSEMQTTLQQNLEPQTRKSLAQLAGVDQDVVELKEFINKTEEKAQRKRNELQTAIDMHHFQPMKEKLDRIHEGLQDVESAVTAGLHDVASGLHDARAAMKPPTSGSKHPQRAHVPHTRQIHDLKGDDVLIAVLSPTPGGDTNVAAGMHKTPSPPQEEGAPSDTSEKSLPRRRDVFTIDYDNEFKWSPFPSNVQEHVKTFQKRTESDSDEV